MSTKTVQNSVSDEIWEPEPNPKPDFTASDIAADSEIILPQRLQDTQKPKQKGKKDDHAI